MKIRNFIIFLCIFLALPVSVFSKTTGDLIKKSQISKTDYYCLYYPYETKIATFSKSGAIKNAKFDKVLSKMIDNRESFKTRYLYTQTPKKKKEYKKKFKMYKKAVKHVIKCQQYKTAKLACDVYKSESILNKTNLSLENEPIFAKIINGQKCEEKNSIVAELKMIYSELGVSSTCSSIQVSQNAFLTSAHCLMRGSLNPDRIQIEMNGNLFEASDFAINPNYVANSEIGDMGLVFINQTLNTKPMKLISKSQVVKENTAGAILGFGIVKYNKYLQRGFHGGFATISQVTKDGILANYKRKMGESNSCYGDSGGPIAINVNGEWKVAGTVSWGADEYCGFFTGEDTSVWSKVTSQANTAFLEYYLDNPFGE